MMTMLPRLAREWWTHKSTPWVLTGLVFLVGGLAARQQEIHHGRALGQHRDLLDRARSYGLTDGAETGAMQPVRRMARHARAEHPKGKPSFAWTAQSTARALADLHKVWWHQRETGDPILNEKFSNADLDEQMDLLNWISRMSFNELEGLLEEASRDAQAGADQRRMGFILEIIAQENPEALLQLITKWPDYADVRDWHVGKALCSLGVDNPDAALRWIETLKETYPDLLDNNFRGFDRVVEGVAAQDWGRACAIAKQVNREGRLGYLLAHSAETDAQRLELLEFMRQHNKPWQLEDAMTMIGMEMLPDFDRGQNWVQQAKLSPQEVEYLMSELNWFIRDPSTHVDCAKWIDWAAEHNQAMVVSKVPNWMKSWMEQDVLAAGTWMANLADGPVKRAATVGYATNIAGIAPDVAAEWVATLPSGEQRADAARKVLTAWSDGGSERDAFAEREGIELKP